jgi:hypothetical protein
MLLFGTFVGVIAIGGTTARTVAVILAAGAIVWGLLVGVIATSWTVFFGGTALGAANAAVGTAFVWAVSWPVRRRRPV